MIATLALLATLALAQDDPPDAEEANRRQAERQAEEERDDAEAPRGLQDWEVEPYWRPSGQGRAWLIRPHNADQIQGLTLQVTPGILGGFRYRFLPSNPNFYGFSRAAGTLAFSLTHNTIGAEARLGSFAGFDHRYVQAWTGPDAFFNLYGPPWLPGGQDYALQPSPGLAWDTRVTLKPIDQLWVFGGITPAVLFWEPRKFDGGAFDEVTVTGGVQYMGPINFSIAYVWWRHAGAQMHGVVLTTR